MQGDDPIGPASVGGRGVASEAGVSEHVVVVRARPGRIVDFSQGVGLRTLYMPDLTMQGGWVAVRSALNLGAPRAARAQGGGWVVLCRSVLYRCTGM